MLVYQRVVLVGKIAICTPYTCMIPEQTYVYICFFLVCASDDWTGDQGWVESEGVTQTTSLQNLG